MVQANPYLSNMRFGKRGLDGRINWAPPNDGRQLVAHVDTFINRYSSIASVYRDADEALIDDRDNARYMRNDLGIRECIDSRQRSVSLLGWHLQPEDDKSEDQTTFCSMLEKIIRKISHFTEYRWSCQNAIWYGKYGIQHRWGVQVIDNKSVYLPTPRHQDDFGWQPLHGDKLVFRQKPIGWGNMPPGGYEGQLGIRVGGNFGLGDVINGRWKVESVQSQVQPTDYGLAYFLTPAERRLMLVHKHHIEDAAYEDGLRAGSMYGIGIRSVIYWEWKQKQETLAYMMEYLERMSGGIQIWKYPSGNKQAEDAATAAAENYNSGQQHILLVPVPPGDVGEYGVEVNEPGFGGIEVVQQLVEGYFSHRIKRYILGQVLSSEAEATGLGSGVAELHLDTLLQIIRSDAINLEETLTSDLVATIIKVNVEKKVFADPGFLPRFTIETEEPDIDKKLEAVAQMMDRGLKVASKPVYEMIGMEPPGPDDEIIAMPQNANPMPLSMDGDGNVPDPADKNGPPADPEKNGKPEPVQRYKRNGFHRSSLPGTGMRFRK